MFVSICAKQTYSPEHLSRCRERVDKRFTPMAALLPLTPEFLGTRLRNLPQYPQSGRRW